MHNEYIESLLTIMATAGMELVFIIGAVELQHTVYFGGWGVCCIGAVTLPAFLIVGALIEICQTLYRQKKRRQNKRR